MWECVCHEHLIHVYRLCRLKLKFIAISAVVSLLRLSDFFDFFFLILKISLLFILEGIINTIWPYILARNLRVQFSFLCMKQSLEILLWPHLIPLWFSWIKKWNLIETRFTLLQDQVCNLEQTCSDFYARNCCFIKVTL